MYVCMYHFTVAPQTVSAVWRFSCRGEGLWTMCGFIIQYILNWPLPTGAVFKAVKHDKQNDRKEQQQQLSRIPNGQWQTSWLFTSTDERLNQAHCLVVRASEILDSDCCLSQEPVG